MLEQIWNDVKYNKRSDTETKRIFWSNPALVKLAYYCKNAKTILDVGCGDGRIINVLWRKDARWWGLDVVAKMKLSKPNVKFTQKWQFREKFDVVYSTYVMEHVDNPQMLLEKMTAVVKTGGLLIIVCPNYGSPLEYSPCYSGHLGLRAIKQIIKSMWWTIFPAKQLEWRRVKPKALDIQHWQQDWDTVCEPYVQTLESVLTTMNYTIVVAESGVSSVKRGFWVRVCIWLGMRGIKPCCYWGPTLCLVAKKK